MRTPKFLCAAALVALAALMSCNKEPETPEPLVKSFGFFVSDNSGRLDADCAGTVSGTEITVGVPPTTDLDDLVARFTTNEGNVVTVGGAALVSGQTSLDYSSPVSLKVEDEDLKASLVYTVKVTLNPDSDPKLTSFKFELVNNPEAIGEDIDGEIAGDAISVPMIKTADKTRLVATFTTAPTNVVTVGDAVQASGETVNDFTNPVDYIVTNSDGSKSALYSVSIKNVNGKIEALATYSDLPVYKAVLKVDPNDKTPYLAFSQASSSDGATTAEKLTVVNFANGAWNVVGSAGFTNKVATTHFDFDIDSESKLYVAYADNEASPKSAKVMTYDGGTWSSVGSETANSFVAQDIRLSAISGKNLVLVQKCNSNTGSFKRNYFVASTYDGTWNSGTVLDLTTMACAASCKAGNAAYALVIRRGNSYHYDVLKYENGTWEALRTNYLVDGATQTGLFVYDIAACEDGTVYVLTADDSKNKGEYRFMVEKYSPEAKDWAYVGGDYYPYVHANRSDEAKIAVAPDGTPYLLYYDASNATVKLSWLDSDTKQWADEVVVETATKGFSDINIAFTTSGVGYIAYTDSSNDSEKVCVYR